MPRLTAAGSKKSMKQGCGSGLDGAMLAHDRLVQDVRSNTLLKPGMTSPADIGNLRDDFSGPDSEQMVPCDDFLAETKEARGVVIEDVALLLFRQERRLVDDGDRALDRSRPDHLI
jgi:hypothetical protein